MQYFLFQSSFLSLISFLPNMANYYLTHFGKKVEGSDASSVAEAWNFLLRQDKYRKHSLNQLVTIGYAVHKVKQKKEYT